MRNTSSKLLVHSLLFFGLALGLSISQARAATDPLCVSDCSARYSYQYCQQACSYNGGQQTKTFMDSFHDGEEAAMKSQMMQKLNNECRSGDEQACTNLREMLKK